MPVLLLYSKKMKSVYFVIQTDIKNEHVIIYSDDYLNNLYDGEIYGV